MTPPNEGVHLSAAVQAGEASQASSIFLISLFDLITANTFSTSAPPVFEKLRRIVDLTRGESFGFLGFDFRRILSFKRAWRAHYAPKLKKRTALLQKLKEIFRRHQSQPVDRVVYLINPILRGWVNYFAVGDSSRCFTYIRDWVEKKIRRHLMRSRKRKGFGWQRWSRQGLYDGLGLFKGYRVSRGAPKAAPA
jgi:RNA-directed DNA polymerase